MSPPVSPPPLKRRRLDVTSSSDTADPLFEQSSSPPTCTSQSLTVYSHNVNGIAPYLENYHQRPITNFFTKTAPQQTEQTDPKPSPQRPSLRSFLRRHSWPDLLFLQELKLSPADSTSSLRALENAVRAPSPQKGAIEEPDYIVFTCLPKDKFNAKGKVYGVASLIRKDFYDRSVERVREVTWDQEGRFLVIETRALPPPSSRPKLALVNVYMVNGTENPYRDPATGEVSGTRHGRKVEVHALLQCECRVLEERGFGVVVAGDVNVARAAIDGFPALRTRPERHVFNRRDFEKRFLATPRGEAGGSGGGEGGGKDKGEGRAANEIWKGENDGESLGMIDTFRYLHPEKKGYTYYPPGRRFGSSCDRVDMILISSSLGPYLKEAGMHETPAERGTSDHVPLYARLEFGGPELK